MRYHFEKPDRYFCVYGQLYFCSHPVYNACTLYKIKEKGLAVVQQRFDSKEKVSWWGEIDPWLGDQIYLHPDFKAFFDAYSGKPVNGLYPTVTVRQIMWALKMKPLKREVWETAFDHKPI